MPTTTSMRKSTAQPPEQAGGGQFSGFGILPRCNASNAPKTLPGRLNYTAVPNRFFEIVGELKPSEMKVLQYIIRRTLGFQKLTATIPIRQFTDGITTRAGDKVDPGCGVKHERTVRRALAALVDKGLICKQLRATSQRGSVANCYGLKFVESGPPPDHVQRSPRVKRRGGGSWHQPIKRKLKKTKQRCQKTRQRAMQPDHVDYLVDCIEQTTGDRRSRGAFAQIALTVDEERIMELLRILKDRRNIRNKGAWFFAVARTYQRCGIVSADAHEPPLQSTATDATANTSYRAWIQQHKPLLYARLSWPQEKRLDTSCQRTPIAISQVRLRNHDPTP